MLHLSRARGHFAAAEAENVLGIESEVLSRWEP
ncbi:uncharacterized protein ANIA_11645 [Aspergillus nidulans FGSC A4]|uniref:Uncharacterized protein n=1 Tax=Emericella nidulans (strain FGSC A4 / ATCC 38163 / CBS 112.46 / NRRL 194 / M139) TaxID=227321 RepID=C8VJS3_EMENI|nr:hypothetical protein [Aspergillus nidulans FGSC A4]CBF82315.1 TPA: hypothetical protein ANIA_11645 [Aspergillus nidulans FGSC A4]